MIEILAVVENTGFRHNLLAQHGQSLLIDYNGKKILFDVGEIYDGFKSNLESMNIKASDIDSVIISHRHIDHIGSLPRFIDELNGQKIYLPTQLGQSDLREYSEKYRFFKGDEQGYNLALSIADSKKLENYSNYEIISSPKEIYPGLYTTGPLGSEMEEQSIVIDLKEKGIVVIAGCSHPTLSVIVEKAKEITGNIKVYGLIGGFHFKDMGDEERKLAVTKVRDLEPEFIVPSHCTGSVAVQMLIQSMGDKVKVAGNGSFGTGNSINIMPELKFNFV